MPIVTVTTGSDLDANTLARLRELLPEAVALAVECPEEPFDGLLKPGDVDIRFRSFGPHDVGGRDVVVEVCSKWFASRADTRQDRCDQLRSAVSASVGNLTVGVYLSLPVAAWSQND